MAGGGAATGAAAGAGAATRGAPAGAGAARGAEKGGGAAQAAVALGAVYSHEKRTHSAMPPAVPVPLGRPDSFVWQRTSQL